MPSVCIGSLRVRVHGDAFEASGGAALRASIDSRISAARGRSNSRPVPPPLVAALTRHVERTCRDAKGRRP